MYEDEVSAAELSGLYENAPCGYHSVGTNGMILRMNRTELFWLGYARNEIVGRRRFSETVSSRCLRDYERAQRSLHDGVDKLEVETELMRKDGSMFDAVVRMHAIHDERRQFLRARATVIDITARKRAETEAQRYATRLRAISRRIVEIQELERRKLSAELHDRIGQDLVAINLNLHIIKDQLSGQLRARVGPRLDDSIRLVESTVGVVRDVAGTLRPPILDDYGLAVTLRSHAEQFSERTGIRVSVEAEHRVTQLPKQAELALFRVGQEALTNVMKHAGANEVRIALEVDLDDVCLTIADNGCGFDVQARSGYGAEGLGLLIMQERLETLGGSLRIDSRPGAGTRVIARVGDTP